MTAGGGEEAVRRVKKRNKKLLNGEDADQENNMFASGPNQPYIARKGALLRSHIEQIRKPP